MNTVTRIASVGLAFAFFACASSTPTPGAARRGPLPLGSAPVEADAPMKSVSGDMVSIAGAKGEQGTLVVFTCNHCPWAKAWEGRITELGNRFSERGVGVIAVNPNDPEAYPEDSYYEMQERAREAGMTFPYVVDEGARVAQAFGATKTPEVFLFDASDRLVYYGAVDDNANEPGEVDERYLENALEAVVSGRPVPVAKTKALGCSIKLPG